MTAFGDVPIPPPWQEIFELMWEAYAAGTIPVGAVVVVDAAGEVVSRGRNRIFDVAAAGQLAGSRLAHAELNALVALSSDRTHEELTLYTALEPCHLCLSAAHAVRVGAVRYAAADPYGGAIDRLLPSEDHRAHPVAVDGPLPGVLGLLPEILHVAHFLWRRPDGGVVGHYRKAEPEVVRAAAQIPAPGAGGSLADALRLVSACSSG